MEYPYPLTCQEWEAISKIMDWLGHFILVGSKVLDKLMLTKLDNNVTSSPAELAQNATYNEEAMEEYFADKTGRSSRNLSGRS
jgi:hypothetical protein